jgi:DNA-binding CsgD family transcriptional regulator
MSLRHRSMRPQDVPACVEMIAAHPIVGQRYGNAISDLCPAWLRLLSADGFCSNAIIEETVEGTRSRMLGVGASVVLSGDFLRELKRPPFFWMGPELAKRVARGDDSALLTQRQIREANSCGGLNLAVWQGFVRHEDSNRAEFWSELMEVFLDNHRGFLFKEIVIQGETPVHLEALRHTGGFLLGRDGRYGDFQGIDLQQLAREPHVVGITRELALQQFGSWISSLFRYQPPRFGFTRSEQRLLLAALAGGTDEELSCQLDASLSTIKKTWRCIYDRVAARLPELIPSNFEASGEASKRGRDKKQHLIAYLREHPEELRPVSRRLLRENAAPGNPPQKNTIVS